ncbi:hypothetical protein [Porphyromonas cangingivalis]|uniref:hypothetical protein n=1 Tax=Porphyromonas cangingivalis TaxID=36874 RepID=UPI00051D9EFF|nr:hypothetical protein [Porphyromonas cangingivalis]KGL48151.1 hypothetical protein HQ34_07990 [Porphyromonas cangingivalis]
MITRIELSPNGPVLLRDGKAQLSFYVRGYYSKDGDKTNERVFQADRIPLNEIKIEASDGQTFKADELFSTTSKDDEITFKATFGEIEANPVTVTLKDVPTEALPKIRVPVVIKALYAPMEAHYTTALNEKVIEQVLERTNKVFSNQFFNAPSSRDSGMEFYLHDFQKVDLSESESLDMKAYIKKNQMVDVDKYLTVWITARSKGLAPSKVAPAYTLGNPDDIPGLNLWKIDSADELDGNIDPINAGIVISYRDFYQSISGPEGGRFEQQVGRFYGLLSTSTDSAGEEEDVDYCPDTYTYLKGEIKRLKSTPHKKNQRPFLYYSYNIMDDYSSCFTISVDQVERMRKVIKDCPYRQQGLNN